jgi:hypothetical protein
MSTKSLEKRPEAASPSVKRRTRGRSRPGWFQRPWVRGVLSILLMLHLTAVFVAPAVAPPTPRSDFFGALHDFFTPYLNLAYINHGYGFFSPDPGSSFIIRYHIERKDGEVLEGVMPDLEKNWPRLLYHRYFMLTSQSSLLPGLPQAYVRHLQKVHDARFVRLQYVEHRPPTARQVRNGMRLDDPSTYFIRAEATIDEHGHVEPPVEPPPSANAEEVPAVAVPAPVGQAEENR